MQTTLLGLAIAFILALTAALVGPYFIDWNQFRPQFEAEATRVIGAPVRVDGALDARLLPTPSLRLRSVVIGGNNDLGKVRADKLDVEFSLGELMRGEWRATELTINGLALDLGLDAQGRIDLPVASGKFNLGSLAIDRLNLTGRIALHDAASRGTLELNDIAFSGDVRSLAGSMRGDGNFTLSGTRYPFRVSSGQTQDGSGTRVHLNVDPGASALAIDLDGVLSFEARAPRFEGALVLASAAEPGSNDPRTRAQNRMPWRVSAKVKADPAAAHLEQLEASYGPDETALKLAGLADLRFGASPLLHAVISARQFDADRFAGKGDDNAAQPVRLLPGLRALLAAIPQAPIPTHIEFGCEQIMLGGRPLQALAADLHADAKSWIVDRLDFRAPGATHVNLSGTDMQPGPSGSFRGALHVDSSDPDMLAAWLQGRGEANSHSQRPLRLNGTVSVGAYRMAIDAMKAEIDGGAVEGRIALAKPSAESGSRFDAELKADRLDLDAAAAFVRSLAGPQADWPDAAAISLDIGHAGSAGQDLHPFVARLGYDAKRLSLDQLRIGDAGSVMVDATGDFDRAHATGKLTLNSSAPALGQITGLVAPVVPALAARLDAMGTAAGPAHLKLALDVGKDSAHADLASARAVVDLDAPQLKGTVTATAKPAVATLRALDLEALRRSEVNLESKMSSEQGSALLALLGLNHAIAAGQGPAQFEGSVSGMWHAPLRLKVKMTGAGLDADAQGSVEPWAQNATANVNLTIRRVDLTPLFGLKPADAMARNVSLSSRIVLAGGKLTLDDLDGSIAGSRLRGRIALTLGDERNVEGEVGLDTLDLAPAFALAIGSAGRSAAEPLGAGLLKGWRGHVTFQALRGSLPGGGELRPVSGTVVNDGQSLTFDDIKGMIGGGAATAHIDARPTSDGIALNARVLLTGVDGTALHYRQLGMPAGHTSLQMTLSSLGRSTSALIGALSGSGAVTLESATIVGLDPRAFDAAIRASDAGQATDDTRLRQIVEPVLSAGVLPVASAQIPFTIRDGRLRVDATTLGSNNARAVVSGGYDIPADQADIRATLASTNVGAAASRPELQLFAAGPPDALNRTVDVAALSSWLAVRAIDRETRRLDSIERGERPPAATPASIPPRAAAPSAPVLGAVPADPSLPDVLSPGHDPRRPLLKPKASLPRPPAASSTSGPPVVSQQVAPLPPAIEVRPAPNVTRQPRPRAPLVLTPPVANPPRPSF
ncbi:MAG TPA: AsmA-like C-terminal region-containing protein [Bradyrhizobium sp.]|nr:AsmA-like C-terminal region-containing protein [Bradyrhizobium sp.]